MTNENKDRLEEAKKEFAGDMGWDHDLLKEEIKALREDADLYLQRIEDLTKERDELKGERDLLRTTEQAFRDAAHDLKKQRDKFEAENRSLGERWLEAEEDSETLRREMRSK